MFEFADIGLTDMSVDEGHVVKCSGLIQSSGKQHRGLQHLYCSLVIGVIVGLKKKQKNFLALI